MFEQAARLKLRFETTKGSVTAEDLWDLPLTSANGPSLDKAAIGLSRQIKETNTESFVTPVAKADEILTIKLEIVKYIISVKVTENAAAATEREDRQRRGRIIEIIARKRDQQLEGASVEELEAMLK